MHLQHLTLTNFRNYARLDLALPSGVILLHGENAQGKTSILEAVYYLATARSPWTSSDRQLLNWAAERDVMPYLRIGAEVMPTDHNPAQNVRRIEITLVKDLDTDRFSKQINIDGVKRRALDLLGNVNVVMFLPQDLALVEGDPGGRRRYLNVALAQVNATYAEALGLYDRALTQRNAVLKRIAERHSAPGELDFWDTELARHGGVIISGRQHLLRELEGLATSIHAELTANAEILELQYKPSFQAVANGSGQLAFDEFGLDLHRQLSADEVRDQFRAALLKMRREEIQRGMTLIGPQRDEIRFSVNGRDLGLYGSRGQARTCILALKLAELGWMERTTGEQPILLLDEFVAELDAARRAYLLARVQTARQAILTTTERDFFTPAFLGSAASWKVHAGRVERDIDR